MPAVSETNSFLVVFGTLWIIIAVAAFAASVYMMLEKEERRWSWPFALFEFLVGVGASAIAYVFLTFPT